MIPAVRGEELKKLSKFKKIAISKIEVGEAYYFIYNVDAVPWGHLGRPVEIAGKAIRVHFANCNVLTGAGNEEPEYFLDIELTSSDLAYSFPDEHITPIAHPQIVDEKKIKALIEADKTIKRTEANERRANRVHMLVKAVGKALRVKSLELVQAAKNEDAMSALMANYVDEAINEVNQQADAVQLDHDSHDPLDLGKRSTNYNIAALTTMKMLNPKPQQSQDSQEVANLAQEMKQEFKRLNKQLELLAVVHPRPAEEARMPQKVAGMASMDGSRNACAYPRRSSSSRNQQRPFRRFGYNLPDGKRSACEGGEAALDGKFYYHPQQIGRHR
jgi:hypothetical protein